VTLPRHPVPAVRLNTGPAMPQLGFGVAQVPAADADKVVALALAAGYRSIDTAAMYHNEEGVGRAIAASGIPRDELFVTTKLGNDEHRAGEVEAAFEQSLQRLGLDHVDLYLIHWPIPAADRYVATWQKMQEFLADGRARAIGVSNFGTSHLQRLLAETGFVPAVNQIELHPYLTQDRLRAFHAEHGIVTEAWSPLGMGGPVLRDGAVAGLAEKYAVQPAQIVLRWHIQLGNVVIPKSATPERIRSNIDVFGFELDEDDLDAVTALNRDHRIGPSPEKYPR
jgi:2,5-diketo-D-gluconate reductase A